MGGGQRSRGVPPGPVGQAEAFQLLGALTVDSHQGVVLLRQAAKLLLQAGDLDGHFLILHQLRQQLPPKRERKEQILLRLWVLGSYVSLSADIEKFPLTMRATPEQHANVLVALPALFRKENWLSPFSRKREISIDE